MLALVGACHERRSPTPTAEHAAQLNDADDMLNDLANEEGPADRPAGPSNSSVQ